MTQHIPPASLFDPVDQRKLSEMVVDQIEDLVISGVLRPGQKLPAERDLAEQLEVSRPKLREGLKLLEDRGLLEVHKSDGTFVSQLTGSALSPAMIALYSRRQSAFYDFLEYRREQESFAAFMAAKRATDADLESFKELMDAMEAAHHAKQHELESVLDVRFHMLIIECSHNSLLLHVMRSIYELMNKGVFYNRNFLYDKEEGMRTKLLEQHKAIAQAIINRDSEGAASAAEAHLNFVEESFMASQDEQQRQNTSQKRQRILRESLAKPSGRARQSKTEQ